MINSANWLPRGRHALGRFSTIATALGIAAPGCTPGGWGLGPDPEPVPTPVPAPEPEPEGVCDEVGPGLSTWVVLVSTPTVALDPWTIILNCTDAPLYVNADGCFGTIARLERIAEDGTVEELPPPWLCAWAGPIDPVVVPAWSSFEQSNQEYATYLETTPGDYRFVFRVSYDAPCDGQPIPPGGPAPCIDDHPWEDLATSIFTFSG